MPDFESNGYQGAWQPGRRLNGEYGMAIVVKRLYAVDLASGHCEPDGEQPPVTMAAEFFDDENPAESSIDKPGELALEKPLVDVFVRATAYAPKGKAVPEFEVGFRIAGALDRKLRIVGDRGARWLAPKKWLSDKEKAEGLRQEYPPPVFSDPRPIAELPIRYEYAYGGKGAMIVDEDVAMMAAEAAEEAEEDEARRARKKEIEAELEAAEEAEEAEKKAAEAGKAPGTEGIADEETREKADGVFSGDETSVVDAETIARLAEEEAEGEELVKVSAYRLGEEDGSEAAGEEEGGEGADEDDGAEADAEDAGEEDEESPFFSGTPVLDDEAESKDELKELLDERARRERRQLRKGDGAHRVRTADDEDLELSDDEWIAKYGRHPETGEPVEAPESEHPEMPYPANPIGRGFCIANRPEAVDALALPNIEDPADPLLPEELVVDLEEMELKALRSPAGWMPYPMGWYPRAGYSGCAPWDLEAAEEAKKKAAEDYDPDDPDDQEIIEFLEGVEVPVMQPRFWQEAHPSMQVLRVNGNEEVLAQDLTPDGTLFFRLPGVHPAATLDVGRGKTPIAMRLDTLSFDLEEPAAPKVGLVWRGWYPLRSLEDIEEFTRIEVAVDEVDQDTWFDIMRDHEKAEEKRKKELGLPEADDDAELFATGDAEQEYKELISRRRRRPDVGPIHDQEEDAEIYAYDEEQKLTDDWEQGFRGENEAFAEETAEKAAAAKAAKKKARKKKARDKADEELGIEREEDE